MQDGIAKLAGTLNIPPEGTDTADLREMFKTTSTTGVDTLWDPYDVNSWTTSKRRVTFFVEVPFASTSAPHTNFDTRFVEHLDVYVRLNSASAQKPLGMACGQMEMDLAQPFNPIANSKPGIRWADLRPRPFGGTVAGQSLDITSTAFGLAADGVTVGNPQMKVDGVSVTGTESLAATGDGAKALILRENSPSEKTDATNTKQVQAGDILLVTTTATRGIDTESNNVAWDGTYIMLGVVKDIYYNYAHIASIAAENCHAVEFESAKGAAVVDATKVFVIHREEWAQNPEAAAYITGNNIVNAGATNSTINYTTKPTTLGAFDTYGSQGKSTGHASSVVDVGDVRSDKFYSVAGILKFTKAGLDQAYQGPVQTVRNDYGGNTLNDTVGTINRTNGCAIGAPGQPFAPVNWVRLGCTSYVSTDYAGWGLATTSAAAKPYDYFGLGTADTTTNAADDIRTAVHYDTDLTARKFHGAATVAAVAQTDYNGKQALEYRGVGANAIACTVGTQWENAILERYYTLFPHLRQTSGVPVTGTQDWGATVSTDAAYALTSPSLTGGKSGTATTSLTGSANTISTQYPMNITCSLLCTFLNYHDKIREDISLENYKDDQPATILAWDCVNEQEDILYGDSTSTYATQPYQEMVLPIKSNHLAYAISIIAFRDLTTAELSNSQARDSNNNRSVSLGKESYIDQSVAPATTAVIGAAGSEVAPRCTFPCYEVVENFKTVLPTYVAVKGSGRPLYEAGVDSNASANGVGGPFASWTATGSKGRGLGCAAAEADLDNLSYNYNTVEGKGSLQGATSFSDQLLAGANRTVTGNLSDHTSAHIISFGLNPTDELANSGCLALQTVNNPTLHLRFPERYVSHKLPKKCFQELELTSVLCHSPAFTGAASPSSFTTTRSSRLIPTREPSRARSTFNFPNGRGFWQARHATHVRNGRDQQHRRASQDHYACNGDGRGHERLHWRTEKGTCQRFRHLDYLTNGSGQRRHVGRLSYRDRSLPYRPLRDRLEKRFAH
jgi:hypothetical protein